MYGWGPCQEIRKVKKAQQLRDTSADKEGVRGSWTRAVIAMAAECWGRKYLDDGQLGHIGAGLACEGAPGGDDQLDGVLDDNGVVDQVAVVRVLQHRPLDKLAVAVAVARVGVLQRSANWFRRMILIALPQG